MQSFVLDGVDAGSTALQSFNVHRERAMLLIPCPYCGPRDVTEFTYGGDADVTRPEDPDAVSDAEWTRYIYIRDNPRGPHDELWQHSAGCRRWLRVRRDTLTHEVFGARPAREVANA